MNGKRKWSEEKKGGKGRRKMERGKGRRKMERENGDREKKKKRETLRIEVRLKLHEWQNQ